MMDCEGSMGLGRALWGSSRSEGEGRRWYPTSQYKVVQYVLFLMQDKARVSNGPIK
jgi:hypothetical protein